MRRYLSFAIASSGFILTGFYILYEYREFGHTLYEHVMDFHEFSTAMFHFFILTAPLVSLAFGHLVNSRMRLLEEMEELKARYKDYYDNAPYGYHSCLRDMTIIEVNRTWLDTLGYEREEVVGRMKLPDLLIEKSRNKLHGVYDVFVRRGFIDNLELDFVKKDGGALPILMSSTAVYGSDGGFVRSRTIVKDNTEKRQYEAALSGVAEEWTKTFDSMPCGVMLLDSDYNIVRANAYISEIAGLPIKEIVKRKCYEIIHGKDRPIEGCQLEGAKRRGDNVVSELYETTLDRHFRIYCSPVLAGGKAASFVHSFVDITDIKQGEKKLIESKSAFFNMLKDASASYRDLKELHNSLILAFANAIDAKSNWTKGHSERVSRYAVSLAVEAGLKEKGVTLLKTAALLHDIGKIGTYDYLLDKTETLTPEEYEVVKRHPVKSAEILGPIDQLKPVIKVVKYHHEHYDGGGYPEGLSGEEIPVMARMLCIADAYDSMTADRPYRPAPGPEYAREELVRCSGTHFDPRLVEAFVRVIDRDFHNENDVLEGSLHGNT